MNPHRFVALSAVYCALLRCLVCNPQGSVAASANGTRLPLTRPNIVLVLTDDQDLLLDSLQALPSLQRWWQESGVNLTNFFANTPICCPSRASLFSGRLNHNNRCEQGQADCCMYADSNSKAFLAQNMGVWLQQAGYRTGMFGKWLNSEGMLAYCAPDNSTRQGQYFPTPPGWDRVFAMCSAGYYNTTWNDQGRLRATSDKPEEYSTSLVGNRSVDWLEQQLCGAAGCSVKEDSARSWRQSISPVFAYIGPYAPHLPSTPAAWYTDYTGFPSRAPVTPSYNYSKTADFHWLVAQQPPITQSQAAKINEEFSNRLRTLLSVDDLIVAVRQLLERAKQLNNTYFIFLSDHGYSLGQYRIPSRKTQAYDNVLRVPALIMGPHLGPAANLPLMLTHADILPTLADMAGIYGALSHELFDGRSFWPLLPFAQPHRVLYVAWSDGQRRQPASVSAQSITTTTTVTGDDVHSPEVKWSDLHSEDVKDMKRGEWRQSVLATYQSIHLEPVVTNGHITDVANNTFLVLRTINRTTDLCYAEFAQLDDWDFRKPYHCELFLNDPYQLTNVYYKQSKAIQQQLHQQLHDLFSCRGTATTAAQPCP